MRQEGGEREEKRREKGRTEEDENFISDSSLPSA